MIENGIAIEDLRGSEADLIASYLKHDKSSDAGPLVSGKFSCYPLEYSADIYATVPGTIDLDNHAKVILALNLMGRRVSARSVLEQYKAHKGHVSSILGDQGFSLNFRCHIIICLLEAPDLQDHRGDLDCLLKSLCEDWWDGNPKYAEVHQLVRSSICPGLTAIG